jgi:hypothetical protein
MTTQEYELSSDMFGLTHTLIDSYVDFSSDAICNYEEAANGFDDEDRHGHYEMNMDKYREFLAKAWLEALAERLKERSINASVKFLRVQTPIAYNGSTDRCEFTLTLAADELELLYTEVVNNNRSVFESYLQFLFLEQRHYSQKVLTDFSTWKYSFRNEESLLHFPAVAVLIGFFLFVAGDCVSPEKVGLCFNENDLEFLQEYESAKEVSEANGGVFGALDWIDDNPVIREGNIK